MNQLSAKHWDRIPILMLAYTVASLLHFVHNATYLHDYPNMPASFTATGVYGAWCVIAAVGAVGYWMYRRKHRVAGLVLIAVYALLGFGGLDHYVLAPVSAHSWVMNLTIAVEVTAAAILLIATVRQLVTRTASAAIE